MYVGWDGKPALLIENRRFPLGHLEIEPQTFGSRASEPHIALLAAGCWVLANLRESRKGQKTQRSKPTSLTDVPGGFVLGVVSLVSVPCLFDSRLQEGAMDVCRLLGGCMLGALASSLFPPALSISRTTLNGSSALASLLM